MKVNSPLIVFMGSADFSIPALRALHKNYSIVGVVTQPDRPAGRGRLLTPPPIKKLADELDISVIQPSRLREPEAMEALYRWSPDLIVVAAFGQILSANVLELPPFGCVNLHASLLPRWRGAAPVQAAILHGDLETGVSIMRMDAGIDTGPVISQRSIAIGSDETSGELSLRLAELGADLLIESLPGYLKGDIQPVVQDDTLATYAPMLRKEHGILDFNRPAVELERQVRAFQPWPGTFIPWHDKVVKVLRAFSVDVDIDQGFPGQWIVFHGQPAVWTGKGMLVLKELQPAGKKPMQGAEFLRGVRN